MDETPVDPPLFHHWATLCYSAISLPNNNWDLRRFGLRYRRELNVFVDSIGDHNIERIPGFALRVAVNGMWYYAGFITRSRLNAVHATAGNILFLDTIPAPYDSATFFAEAL